MAEITIKLKATVAWWVKPYLGWLTFLHYAFGYEPDFAKVSEMIDSGVSVKVSR